VLVPLKVCMPAPDFGERAGALILPEKTALACTPRRQRALPNDAARAGQRATVSLKLFK